MDARARRLDAVKLAAAIALSAAALGGIGIRGVAYRAIERRALITPPRGPETPTDFGAPFARLAIPSGPRRLDAVAVEADAPGAPVVVLFHGTNESVSSWARAQALWRAQGVSSLVFDYAGFGASDGRARAVHCDEDARAAWAAARRHFGPGRRYVAVGYSLGTGVLLDVEKGFAPRADALALVAGYTSARAAAPRVVGTPPWLTPLMPDLWNNARALARLDRPLLVLHSAADETFPLAMAESLATIAGPQGRLARLEGYAHADGHRAASLPYWAPLLAFVKASPTG